VSGGGDGGGASTGASALHPALARVALALDLADADALHAAAVRFGPRVGVLKVGLEAFVRLGPAAVEAVRPYARHLFLDLKLHDIPATVAAAVRAARALGVDFLTVHAGGGPAMLAAAAAAAGGEVALLGVTLLTHLDDRELAALDLPGEASARVARWAGLAEEAGCAGVVCSPLECEALRPAHPRPFQLVTPGVRFAGEAAGDQRRVATPAAALAAGADLLVVGRAVTAAADPDAALDRLASELASVL
jgi:orotidine-5'-phosphate decarboxylase